MVMRLDPDWLLETEQSDYFEGFDVPWSFFGSRGAVIGSYPGKEPRRVLRVARIDPAFPRLRGAEYPLRRDRHAPYALPPRPGRRRVPRRTGGSFLATLRRGGPVPQPVQRHAGRRRARLAHAGALLGHGEAPAAAPPWTGRPTPVAPLRHESAGPCYLRLKALADAPDRGRNHGGVGERKNITVHSVGHARLGVPCSRYFDLFPTTRHAQASVPYGIHSQVSVFERRGPA